MLFWYPRHIKPRGKKNSKFWPVINSMQWLINSVFCRSNWTKYKKWVVSAQNESHALFTISQSVLIKRGKGNIVGSIFINYGVTR